MKKTQIEMNEPPKGAPPWRRRPVEILETWNPKVGDVLVGEFSAHGPGAWSGIEFNEMIRLRTAPLVDTPVVVTGREVVHTLRQIQPKLGDLLRFERLPDEPGQRPPRISVELIEPELDFEGFGNAA